MKMFNTKVLKIALQTQQIYICHKKCKCKASKNELFKTSIPFDDLGCMQTLF